MRSGPGWVVSCEHAGCRVPPRYRQLFAGHAELLRSHRGWDAGAAPLARELASALGRRALLHLPTRLLVDANRSPTHRACFSELSRGLPAAERRRVLQRIHAPHRRRVAGAVETEIARHGACVHVGVHTFTPRRDGVERTAEVGLLYDPGRAWERDLCACWRSILERRATSAGEVGGGGEAWRIRRNYPYRGVADGLTTTLRGTLGGDAYAGIELEVNQALLGTPGAIRRVGRLLTAGVGALVEWAAATATSSSSSAARRGPDLPPPSPRP